MAKLFEELKRRNVFRVVGAYLVVGWITLQVIDIVQPALGLPEWINTFIIYLLLAGLPVTVIMAWVFEITPQGILRDEGARTEHARAPDAGRRTDFVIIGLLAVALTYFVWDKFLAPDPGNIEVTVSEASIAVLPFADLSPEGDQEYFADGISEEILNALARVPKLRVAARTSSFQFRKQNLDIPEIARRLNVANVLEGSVRKAGTRVRITAQLIDAKTGFHLWSDTYDREMLDILTLQDEIAAAIVGELKKRLSADWDMEMPMRTAMHDSAAYDEYLLGRHMLLQRGQYPIERAVVHFRSATEIDPGFAPAWASLAAGTLLLANSPISYGGMPVSDALSEARVSIERALALDPDLGDAHAARGLAALIEFDVEGMQEPLERAIALNPGDTQARHWLAISLDLQDRLEESLELREEIVRLDPLFSVGVSQYADALTRRGRYDEARVQIERLRDLNSDFYIRQVANLEFEEGRYAEALLATRPPRHEATLDAGTEGFAMGLLLVGLPEEAAAILGRDDRRYLLYMGEVEAAIAATTAMPPSDSPTSTADAAKMLAMLGQYQAAIDLYDQRVWKRIPESAQRYLGTEYLIFYALAKRETGAVERAEELFGIAEARLASRRAAGENSVQLHLNTLDYWLVRGQPARALPFLRRALPLQLYLDALERHPVLGPAVQGAEFKVIIAAERNHRQAEKAKFLAVACADEAPGLWRPLPQTCATVDGSGG